MTTVGVFHSVFNACGPLTRDQEREGYLPPGILLGSNLLQFNCTMVSRGKGVLTRTFLVISEGFCPPSDNISQTAGITRQLLSIYCLQQDKKNVATVSQMQKQTKTINALARLTVIFCGIWPKRNIYMCVCVCKAMVTILLLLLLQQDLLTVLQKQVGYVKLHLL